jgi:hypothetical protein
MMPVTCSPVLCHGLRHALTLMASLDSDAVEHRLRLTSRRWPRSGPIFRAAEAVAGRASSVAVEDLSALAARPL